MNRITHEAFDDMEMENIELKKECEDFEKQRDDLLHVYFDLVNKVYDCKVFLKELLEGKELDLSKCKDLLDELEIE